jgi:hypothetical protein
MERTVLRFGIRLTIFLILFPTASMAGVSLVERPERPVGPGISRPHGEPGGLARLQALFWDVFEDWMDHETCADSPCMKSEPENRVGIDPNGNK